MRDSGKRGMGGAVRRALWAAALWLTGGSVLCAQQGQSYFEESDIPLAVRENGMAGKLRNGRQSGDVFANARDRKISIHWTSSTLENQEPDYSLPVSLANNTVGTATATSDTQTIITGFYPTALGKIDNEGLLVCGIRTTGKTVVQKWTVVWPPSMPATAIDPVTGFTRVPLVFPTFQKQNVYVGSALGTPRYATGICALRKAGTPEQALVQFAEPNDIMTLDLISGQLSLVASETNPIGLLGTIGALSSKNYSQIGLGDKIDTGYCYRFWRGNKNTVLHSSGPGPEIPILVLVDAGRNGTLDAALELSPADFVDDGFQDMRNYATPWLE